MRVEATGLCRSDWHGWKGHDPDVVAFPHVPGHELAGVVEAVGADVARWRAGRSRDRAVRLRLRHLCRSAPPAQQQICDAPDAARLHRTGASFAEFVAVDHADVNLVGLPEDIGFDAAASLGCRFATAFRAVVARARRAQPGEWVAVHGCGGVGLSAVMVAAAGGARVVAIDVVDGRARRWPATSARAIVRRPGGRPGTSRDATGGGAHVASTPSGSRRRVQASITGLRKPRPPRAGRAAAVRTGHPAIPMDLVIARELELLGSHGMAAHDYPEMMGAHHRRPPAARRADHPHHRSRRRPRRSTAMSDGSRPRMTVIRPG